MKGKYSWCFPILLLSIVLLVTVFLGQLREAPDHGELHSQRNQITFPSRTLEWLFGGLHGRRARPSGDDGGGDATGASEKYKGIPLSPNLSTCDWSFSKGHHHIYCCPVKPESEQPIKDFEFPSRDSPVRIRRAAHLADEDYFAKYEKAVSLMKQLPPDHPHNWWRQSKTHCRYCTGAYQQSNSTIPLNVHRSWLFFPWHRIFIYFHERVLGKLIGDDTFALPYWNWDSPIGMVQPDIYMKGSLSDAARDRPHLAPQVADIDFNGVESSLDTEDQIATNLAFMYNQMVSGAKKLELFMGCPLKSGDMGMCDGPGTIERSPHNTLHTWVGSRFNPERENMGSFYSAARDPIFYAHHANIDRMWTVWKKINGNKSEIWDSEWLDSHFYFYDENVNLVRVKVRDCLDTDKLRYRYEEVDLPWLNARPKPSVPPKIARNILRMREDNNGLRMPGAADDKFEEFGNQQQGAWTLDKTITTRVNRPRRQRTDEEEEVMVVYGIEIKKDMYVKFDVFVNVVDETITSPRSREFVGSFVYVPHGVRPSKNKGKHDMKMKRNLKLGISELLEDLEANKDDSIWVSLVPRGGTGVNTTVDGIRIEYML